ncbi:MAG: succinate dehydrogenase cytochrome b subunit [Deltaproteobacteria bacterium]|nr:succinate dehydrogenase cytochrome b subunit [Deltaproteobacteria bacterium]
MSKPPLLSSIGKKQVVALSGIALMGFIAMHLLGNANIYFGAEFFNKYAHKLHSLGPLMTIAEVGLLAVFLLHIAFALTVTAQNLAARPVRYKVKKSSSERTPGSRFMAFSGVYMLVFIIVHLVNFRAQRGHGEISEIVGGLFQEPAWAIFYSVSMLLVALHVSHGFWSAFQTLGGGTAQSHVVKAVRNTGVAFSLIVGLGFAGMPIVVCFFGALS